MAALTTTYKHDIVKRNIHRELTLWAESNPFAMVFAGADYGLEKYMAPRPDVSVVFTSRLSPDIEGLMPGAPEIAIEVVSSEPAHRLEKKRRLYLSNGGKAVVAAYPITWTVWIFRLDGGAQLLEEHETLEIPDILPGFSMPLSAIFEGITRPAKP